MKKCLLIFLMLFPVLLWAQSNEEKVMKKDERIIRPYLTLGFNATQVFGDDLNGFRKFGANGGAGTYIMLPKNFSVGFEILYNQKGSRAGSNEKLLDSVYEYKLILDYIDVPVMISYHDKDRAIFSAGLAYTALVRYKELRNEKEFEYAAGTPYKRNGMEFVASFTFIFKKHYGVNVRYCASLLDITSRSLPFSDRKGGGQINNYLSLRGTYLF